MNRLISDIVSPAPFSPTPPTTVTTFYDGLCPVCRGAIARYARIGAAKNPDLLWRDINDYPDALACFGVSREAVERRIHVVDRTGALRAGVDAAIAVWRELPRRRWRARLLSLPMVHSLAGLIYDHVFAPSLRALSRRQAPR
ncbi:MAG: thiol-disulfide oxidoreductase DCC family protein [Alphaproteobacteria bacterium]